MATTFSIVFQCSCNMQIRCLPIACARFIGRQSNSNVMHFLYARTQKFSSITILKVCVCVFNWFDRVSISTDNWLRSRRCRRKSTLYSNELLACIWPTAQLSFFYAIVRIVKYFTRNFLLYADEDFFPSGLFWKVFVYVRLLSLPGRHCGSSFSKSLLTQIWVFCVGSE